jgi:hypothetical protein
MGFASGLDAGDGDDEPEGPPAVLLAGFRAEEIPRVRELLDELGGHDVPVVPVAQTYLERPLIDALQIPEPDWESPRSDATFGVRGGDFGSRRCVVFSGLDRGEMAIIVSAIESRGLPRLVTAVVTSENCERSLGEALALAVRDARSDARRKEETSLKSAADLEAAMRAVDAAAAAETLSAADLVQREIDRQDALAADEAAALNARNERATRAERHMEKLKQEYVERARARAPPRRRRLETRRAKTRTPRAGRRSRTSRRPPRRLRLLTWTTCSVRRARTETRWRRWCGKRCGRANARARPRRRNKRRKNGGARKKRRRRG